MALYRISFGVHEYREISDDDFDVVIESVKDGFLDRLYGLLEAENKFTSNDVSVEMVEVEP